MHYIHLYSEHAVPALNMDELLHYVNGMLPRFIADLREDLIATSVAPLPEEPRAEAISRLAERFARARVRNPNHHETNPSPLPGEIDYERRRLTGLTHATGILYDGDEMSEILRDLIAREEANLDHIHIVFSNQLFGTWDSDDLRYHARVSLYGFPSLISTTGLVEAPAKPREFYFLKQRYAALGLYDAPDVELKTQLKGRFIDYGDERTTGALEGYVMQAVIYHLSGDAFCSDPDCRLFNAHWQEEVIRCQLQGDYELCPVHRELLERLAG